jgi:hypothetical protein
MGNICTKEFFLFHTFLVSYVNVSAFYDKTVKKLKYFINYVFYSGRQKYNPFFKKVCTFAANYLGTQAW